MPISVEYVARETASNLWRNRLMTIAAVLTVAVSLSLVGAAMLLRQGVAHATTKWQHGVNVLVFVNPGTPEHAVQGTTGPTVDSLKQQILALPYVRSCLYRSPAYDYNEAKHILPPDESQALTVATMPASLRCVLQNPNEAQAMFQYFKCQQAVQGSCGIPPVKNVSYPSQAVKNMEEVTRVLQIVFFTVAGILGLSAIVLVLNTIRLAIFARRREVSVMKLVGATNWFIRVPFMCEGLVQGVLGAVVAALVVIGLHWMLDAFAGSGSGIFYQMRMPTGEVAVTDVVVVLFGLLVGTLGSAFAIRRFLET
ncbi:MAG TPA: FtsX-like permease family protein [Acidimicrobiales bacterium]|nr:FtsX-like permease family protein [Acidimicrobiales bacterium]